MSELIESYKKDTLALDKKFYKKFREFVIKNLETTGIRWFSINMMPIVASNQAIADKKQMKDAEDILVILASSDYKGASNIIDAENLSNKDFTDKAGLTREDIKVIKFFKKEILENFDMYKNIFSSNSNEMTVSIPLKAQQKLIF